MKIVDVSAKEIAKFLEAAKGDVQKAEAAAQTVATIKDYLAGESEVRRRSKVEVLEG